MGDLAAVAATIQGAQIQANYALWAAVLSSSIGAVGIVIAAWYAYKNGLRTQLQNHLLESRREIYLDFISKANDLVSCGYLIDIHPETYYEKLHLINLDFETAIQKVLLICETKHQKEIFNFYEICNKKFNLYINEINEFRIKKSKQGEITDLYFKIENELEVIKSRSMIYIINNEEEYNQKLNKVIVEFDEVKTFHLQFEKSKNKIRMLSNDLLLDTKRAANKVNIALRSELGISTDIDLETDLGNNFFKRKDV